MAAPPLQPVDFSRWIEENKASLSPPVCNKLLFGGQQKVMVVGGSQANDRRDYHIEAGEEIFYQLKGRMIVRIMEQGKPKDVVIEEGEIFCLPGRIPHSPQRFPDTMGLVLERERRLDETDGLRWHTMDGTNRILYQEWFYCADLGTQLGPAIGRFKASEACATGIPAKDYEAEEREGKFPVEVDKVTVCSKPVNLMEWVAANAKATGGSAVLCGPGSVDPCLNGFEYSCRFVTGPLPDEWEGGGDGGEGEGNVIDGGELFLYTLKGSATVTLTDLSTKEKKELPSMGDQHVLIIPGGGRYAARIRFAEDCVVMMVTNSMLDRMAKEAKEEAGGSSSGSESGAASGSA